jgi:hypothetical protein
MATPAVPLPIEFATSRAQTNALAPGIAAIGNWLWAGAGCRCIHASPSGKNLLTQRAGCPFGGRAIVNSRDGRFSAGLGLACPLENQKGLPFFRPCLCIALSAKFIHACQIRIGNHVGSRYCPGKGRSWGGRSYAHTGSLRRGVPRQSLVCFLSVVNLCDHMSARYVSLAGSSTLSRDAAKAVRARGSSSIASHGRGPTIGNQDGRIDGKDVECRELNGLSARRRRPCQGQQAT